MEIIFFLKCIFYFLNYIFSKLNREEILEVYKVLVFDLIIVLWKYFDN